jgi:hypothetical protein
MGYVFITADPCTSEAFNPGTGTLFVLSTSNYAPTTSIGRGQCGVLAYVSVENAPIRYTLAPSATPATSTGHPLAIGDYIVLNGISQLMNFKGFNEGAVATSSVKITYFIG